MSEMKIRRSYRLSAAEKQMITSLIRPDERPGAVLDRLGECASKFRHDDARLRTENIRLSFSHEAYSTLKKKSKETSIPIIQLIILAAREQSLGTPAMEPFIKENDDLSADRQCFWEILDELYSTIRTNDNPETLERLVDISTSPPGLPITEDGFLRDYRSINFEKLNGSNLALFNFCSSVYPPKQVGRLLSDCTMVKKIDFDRFHLSRGKLARFWNRVGREVFLKGSITPEAIKATFSNSHRLLKILSYLEIHLTFWTEDEGGGKEWLFKLSAEW